MSECSSAGVCVFGQARSDDHPGHGGHDGCSTRDDLLAKNLTQAQYRRPADECVVISGVLDDRHTGQAIEFTKTDAIEVHIDHVYPVATAWDMGAWQWPKPRQIKFANDQKRNLLAVDGPANQAKGDRGPGRWMPSSRGFTCDYVAKYLRVAVAYELPITKADPKVARAGSKECSS